MRRHAGRGSGIAAALVAAGLLAWAADAAAQAGSGCTPAWQPTFAAPNTFGNKVNALAVFDDGSGSGPQLYAGGAFVTASGVQARCLAKWDGSSWSEVGGGVSVAPNGTQPSVDALAVHDDGSGPALFVGGEFNTAGSTSAGRIAKWNGSTWSVLGTASANGVNGKSFGPNPEPEVLALASFDVDHSGGPELYVGGYFLRAGSELNGLVVNNIAAWYGGNWRQLETGVSAGTGAQPRVNALTAFDDGSGGGPALYAGGQFTTAGSAPVNGVAKWNGTTWSPLAFGPNNCDVRALAVFDDGNGGGPALYAAGSFAVVAGQLVNHIAKWDGAGWSPLGTGMSNGYVLALAVFDDGSGSGPALYAGGSFTSAGGVPSARIARWDGSAWSPLGTGVEGAFFVLPRVNALTAFDVGDGAGTSLHAGGDFKLAGGIAVGGVSEWGGCPAEPQAWTDLGWALPGSDGPPLLLGTGALVAGGAVQLTLTHANPAAFAVLFTGLAPSLTPFKGGTLLPVPVLVSVTLATSASGSIALPFHWPPGVPSGFQLHYQYGIQDPAAVQGVALSNALRSTTP